MIRVVGHRDVQEADPFLLLDAFNATTPAGYIKGLPMHLHRGIETVTCLIEGRPLREPVAWGGPVVMIIRKNCRLLSVI